jgi:hypothetical protein
MPDLVYFIYGILYGPTILLLCAASLIMIGMKTISLASKLSYSSLVIFVVTLFVISWGLPPMIKEFANWQALIIGLAFLLSWLIEESLSKKRVVLLIKIFRRKYYATRTTITYRPNFLGNYKCSVDALNIYTHPYKATKKTL